MLVLVWKNYIFGISGASVLLCTLYGLSQSKAIAEAAGAVESMTIIFSLAEPVQCVLE